MAISSLYHLARAARRWPNHLTYYVLSCNRQDASAVFQLWGPGSFTTYFRHADEWRRASSTPSSFIIRLDRAFMARSIGLQSWSTPTGSRWDALFLWWGCIG